MERSAIFFCTSLSSYTLLFLYYHLILFLFLLNNMPDNSVIQNVGLAGAAVASLVTLLAIKYNDRPAFYEHPKDIPYNGGLPLVGNLPELINNVPRLHDYVLELFEKLDTLTL
jgi:fatty acid omega-hydroxylase